MSMNTDQEPRSSMVHAYWVGHVVVLLATQRDQKTTQCVGTSAWTSCQ